MELMDRLVLLEQPEHKESLVLQVLQAHKEQPDPQEQREFRVLQDPLALQVLLAKLELQAQLALPELTVRQAQLEQQVHKVFKVTLETRA